MTPQPQPRAEGNECRDQTVCLIVLGSCSPVPGSGAPPCLGNGAAHGGLDLPTSTNLRQSPTGVPTPAPWRLSLTGTLFSRDPGLCEVDSLNCRSAQGSAQGSAQASIGGKKVTFTQAPLNVEIIRETRMVATYVSFWSFCDHSENYWGWMQDDKIIKAKKVVKKKNLKMIE